MISNKRILIINSHSIYEENATGITIRSILSTFSKESLLEVYYYPSKESKEHNKIKSIKLDKKTKVLDSWLRRSIKTEFKEKVNKNIIKSDKRERKSFMKSIKALLLATIDYFPINMKYNKNQITQIDKFRPEIIYTLGSAILPLEVSLFFSERYDIPIVLHHMDNWRETKYSENILMKPSKIKLLNNLKNVENNMDFGMTISDDMANYYNSVSDSKYISLMHVVSEMKIQKKNDEKIINIVYAGGLHLNRWKVLIKFERVLQKIVAEGFRVRLSIYTKDTDRFSYEDMFSKSITSFFDFLPYNEVYRIYEVADILIHVESFEEEIVKFTQYSLSTKIPEYMSTGIPIICYAPSNIAVSNYVTKNNFGFSVSSQKDLYDSLKKLISNKNLRNEMGNNGKNIAKIKHSEIYKDAVIRKVFKL